MNNEENVVEPKPRRVFENPFLSDLDDYDDDETKVIIPRRALVSFDEENEESQNVSSEKTWVHVDKETDNPLADEDNDFFDALDGEESLPFLTDEGSELPYLEEEELVDSELVDNAEPFKFPADPGHSNISKKQKKEKTPKAPKEKKSGGKKKWWILSLVLLLVLVAAAGIVFFSRIAIVGTATSKISDATDPCTSFTQSGLVCSTVFNSNSDIPRNSLISQSLTAGSYVRKGESIQLVYSKGPESALFPLVSGKTQDEAKKDIFDIGGTVSEIETVSDVPSFKAGEVVKAFLDSTGQEVTEGTTVLNGFSVKLQVSSGQSTVPNFVGKTEEQIQADATAKGWKVNFVEVESDFVPGLAYEQNPKADSLVPNDTEITINIAKEPASKEVKVPDVVGKSKIEAQTELSSSGFKEITTVEVKNCEVTGSPVVTQVVPGVGKTANTSEAIVIIVSKPGKCTG